MINLLQTINHMNIPTESASRAIQAVRGKLQRASSESAGAVALVKALLDIDVKFNSHTEARIATFALVEDIIKNDCVVNDLDEAMGRAMQKANSFINNSTNSWMFVSDQPMTKQAVVDGVDTKVIIKANGSIKKGGKKILALEIYKRELLKGDVLPGELAKMFVNELGMTLSGARTYVYDTKKAYNAQ